MKDRIKTIVKTKHLFIYLLPIFFVLHGFTENYILVKVKDALVILAAYIFAAYFIAAVVFLFFKDRYKARLFTFSLLFINFFFGVVVEWLNRIAKDSVLTKYSFLLSVTFLLLVIIFIWLKRKKRIPVRLIAVINIFLIMILLVDSGWLVSKINSKNYNTQFSDSISLMPFTAKEKPNIYLIITDGYAGDTELKDMFAFDNSDFKNALSQRGFHNIKNTTSNYNYTVISMASALNMTYLRLRHNNLKDNLRDGLRAIRETRLETFLKNNGYKIKNLSIFESNDRRNGPKDFFYLNSYQLLTSSTLLYHITAVIYFKLVQKLKLQFFDRGQTYTAQKSNDHIYSKTIELSKIMSDTPCFVYTHLLMPHVPYYFDNNGNPNSFDKLLEDNKFSKKDYLQYLQYDNKKLITLIDEIRKNSADPPVIILMSDHGFRQFKEPVDKKYHFSNLISIYLPDSNYSRFYDGMSNVNVFRTFLNAEFEQNLPLAKDSTIFLNE
jgi:hypothetical protein